MNLQGIKIRVYRWVKKIVLYGLYAVLCLGVGGFLILQIPSVQTALTRRIMSVFSKVSGFDVRYERFHLVWYDRLELDSLTVTDPAHNTMIAVDRLRVNFTLGDLWHRNKILIDNATIEGATVNLVDIAETDTSTKINITMFVDAIARQFSSSSTTPNPTFTIASVNVAHSHFSYRDPKKDSIREGFDYAHFRVDVPKGEVTDFRVIGDTVQLHVDALNARDEKTNLAINELETQFRFSSTAMEFLSLHLSAGKSTVTDSVIFRYSDSGDLSEFNTRVTVLAKLRHTVIDPADLALFAPATAVIGQPVHLDGVVEGRVNKFSFRQMQVAVGNTRLAGELKIEGLPTLPETFITLNLAEAHVVPHDLRFLFADDVFARLTPLGNLRLRGKFYGYPNDFVANGEIDTQLGSIRSDLNLKLVPGHADESTYRGTLELDGFDLGRYLRDTATYQRISLKGKIDGKGLTRQAATFTLNGSVRSVGLWGYDYQNITIDARLARQLFDGQLSIRDPHLKFAGAGSIDLRNNRNLVRVNARLDTAFLKDLHLTKEKVFVSTSVDIDSHGLALDSLLGRLRLHNTTLLYIDETIYFDSIRLTSDFDGRVRTLGLRSSMLNATATGNYYYTTLFADLRHFAHDLYLNLKNDRSGLSAYYQTLPKSTRAYSASFSIELIDINPLIDMLNLPLTLSKNALVNGAFSEGNSSVFHVSGHVDTIRYRNKVFAQNDIELSGSKIRDNTGILAAATVRSGRQSLSDIFQTKNFLLQGLWNNSEVNLDVDFDQEGYDNLVRLRSRIDFLADSTRIRILPSRIKALDQEWDIDQKNYTLFRNSEWQIHNLELYHADQLISLNGSISQQPDPAVTLTLKDLNLNILDVLSTEKFGGTLNGEITARDLFHNPYLENRLTVHALTVDAFLVGDITGSNSWNPAHNGFDINFVVDRLGKRIVNIGGIYNPDDSDSPLAVNAELQQTNLKIIEPLLRGLFSELDGTISGSYAITGTFGSPQIKGEGKIADGKIMIDYLKTMYSFSGALGMTNSQILFRDMTLIDEFKNKATLKGTLSHRSFSDMRINLDAVFNNLQVLNTTAKDNTLFYGQGYASGKMNMSGALSDLRITASARSEKNTKIFIPINGTGSVEKKDFITFTHFTDRSLLKADKTKEKKKQSGKALSGIAVDLNLDLTPAALVEIIFDIKSGDIIRGRGNGNLKIQLDTKGEFNMFGSVEFTEGAYNFTLYDIINKEFTITKGSRISWFGDPYQGTMNITASYKQLALVTPILSDQSNANSTAPALHRRYPIEVILKLDGPMLTPQINFDIDAKDLPNSVPIPEKGNASISLSTDFLAFKARLDEQELKKQVFSLIMLRRFSPYGESLSTSGGLSNSVSELFSNQLSYWLSQMNQNLEIDVDLGAFDQEAFNTFQLRLSYSFLNGRLRVTRDGAFNNQYNRSDASTIAGDWTVDYLLTPDGKFKVKMYSRTNTNIISTTTQSAVTTGVSLLHTQNFNQVKDLLRSARRRRELELQKPNQPPVKEDETH